MLARPRTVRAQEVRSPAPVTVPPAPAWSEEDEIRGLLRADPGRREELRRADPDRLLQRPLPLADLEALAWLRSPAVHAARARLESVRTGYAQSEDLSDLVAAYRSFLRETRTRVGPERSRRPTERIAPSPNVGGLSAELVRRSVAIAREDLREAVRHVVARAQRLYADSVRLHAVRRILSEDVALHEALLAVARARFAAGGGTQTGLLAFQARLEALRTERGILDDESVALRARWNALLSRPAAAPLALPESPADSDPIASEAGLIARALEERQELRRARLTAERAALAVRLGETLVLPRLDLGTSRFERERAGEAGVQRGDVFPATGRLRVQRSDFGVREAQLAELRARQAQARHAVAVRRDETRERVSAAVLAVTSAAQRRRVHDAELIPLARRALESARGSYEGGRTGYMELLDSARALLQARLGGIDARRTWAHAAASLLEAVGVRPHAKDETR
jgi:outer membrane protein TolC